MTITAIIILYAVSWFMTLFVILPLRVTTQNDTGEIIPGTAPSAPVDANLRAKLFWTTVVATIIWAVICGVIWSGVITAEDIASFTPS